MDVYSDYNQIPMSKMDKIYTTYIIELSNYHYDVMPFGLKNTDATYQPMMNKIFKGEIRDMLKVYMDDMIVKSQEEVNLSIHLRKCFDQARRVKMRFNPEKCTFGVRSENFLDFYLTECGI